MFSSSCSTDVAPLTTAVIAGFASTQASANRGIVTPAPSAIFFSCSIASKFGSFQYSLL